MKYIINLKHFYKLIFVLVLASNLDATPCSTQDSPSGLNRIEMGNLKQRELMPSYSYKCDDKGDKQNAGAFICLQMLYCPHQLTETCLPSSVQGSVFRMDSSGVILDRYSLNIDNAGSAIKGKKLYVDDTINIKNAFCPDTKALHARAIRRFQCLCNKKYCKESEPLDLYIYAKFPNLNFKTDDELLENALTNSKPEYDRTGREVTGYFHFNDNQSARLNEIINGQSPIRTCKDKYVETPTVQFFGRIFASVIEKQGLTCANTTSQDFVLLPSFSSASEKLITPDENLDGKSDNVAQLTFEMIQQARKSLGGCFPNPDTIDVGDKKSLNRSQTYIPEKTGIGLAK